MKMLLGFVAVCLFATAATGATISGTVTQLGSAAPLPSMNVAAYDASGVLRATAATDAQGRYTLNLDEGTYRVLAYDPAGVYATSFYDEAESFDTSRQIALQAEQSVSPVDFALARGGFVAGTVTAASSPRPAITVAAYNLSGTLRGFTKTDGTGRYHLALPAGSYKLAAYDDARVYATSFHHDSASFAGATPVGVSAEATTTVDFQLSAGARIRGRVTELASDLPLGGIVATAYGSAGEVVAVSTSANNGTYELLVPAGSYRIVFEDRIGIYASVYYPGAESFDTSTTIEIAAGGSIVDVDAVLQRGGRIAGSVRDADSGAPLGSIVVAAYNASGTVRTFTTTDANGAYTLVVRPGFYKVGAYDANIVYAPQFHSGQPAFAYGTMTTVAAGATVAPIDFLLRRGGHLSGRVTDRATGAPIAGITVAAYDLVGTRVTSVRTTADGTYRLVLAAGVYRLVAFDEGLHYANGYLDDSANLDASRTLTVANEAELTALDFSMSAGAKVSGNVVDLTHGGPVAGVMVTAYDLAATAIASGTTDPSGDFAFVVPYGTYRFIAADPLHRFDTSFFQNAASFADAQPVTLIAGGSAPAILFRLIAAPPLARRRAVRH